LPEPLRERLNGRGALYQLYSGDYLLVSDYMTNEPVMSAWYRILGWVEKAEPSAVYHHAHYELNPADGKKHRVRGEPMHLAAAPPLYWLHMCKSQEIDVNGQKLPTFPAASFREFFAPLLNPAFDEVLEQGQAPTVPLFQVSREILAGLLHLGYSSFIDVPREAGGDWFMALKSVKLL
jgi:hypothetical protein